MSEKKSRMIFEVIEESDDFFKCPVEKHCRSRVNIPFTIADGDADFEKEFLDLAKKAKLYTLAGHRSVGGVRASLYNGMPMEGVEKLAEFMQDFLDERMGE